MRTPVLVAANHKGGVGKTTVARVLAQAIAGLPELHKDKPVLVVDLDPQANISRRWELMRPLGNGLSAPINHPDLEGESSSVCDLWLPLLGVCDEPLVPEPYPTANPMIDVVPANEELMLELVGIERSKRHLLGDAMRQWLRSEDIGNKYSYVILDTAPSKTTLWDAAVAASTHVLVPFKPEPQSVEGVVSIVSYLYQQQLCRPHHDPLIMLGFLPNMVQRTRLHAKLLKQLKSMPGLGRYLMPVKLHQRIGYAETDAPSCDPTQVTDMDGTAIQAEALRFAKYIAAEIERPASQAGAQEVNNG